MSELDKDTSYLRATLNEMATRLQYPGSQSSVEIIRDGHVAAAILLLLRPRLHFAGRQIAVMKERLPPTASGLMMRIS